MKNIGHMKEEKLPSGTERILFVDDEAPIAKMGSQILERLGYQGNRSNQQRGGIGAVSDQNPNDFDLVITDMTMPNMTGDKLAIEIDENTLRYSCNPLHRIQQKNIR